MATHRMSVTKPSGQLAVDGQHAPMEPAAAVHSPEDVQNDAIGLQVQRVLASAPFRNSKRNTQFLHFVVEKALAGSTAQIKERLIGVEVFGRPVDYDLSADPIVRVAAAELRKRIAQYYAEQDHAGELRVELPLGTYAPIFYWPNPTHKDKQDLALVEDATITAETKFAPAIDPETSHHAKAVSGSSKWTSVVVACCVIGLVAMSAIFAAPYFKAQAAQSALNAFWAPLMNGSDSITVCVGDLNYIFKAPPFTNALQLPETADNLLNPNAGAALLRVGSILGSRGKRSTLRLADLTALNDLRQQPVILIGGMNNPWTQRILAGLRFRLTNRPGGIGGDYSLVIDEKDPAMNTWRIDIRAPLSSITRDYSLITRLNDPLTGEPVVILCGLGPYGTAAASEFVSSPSYFSEFTRQAPKGWENQNLQIVLETTVVDGRVSVPRVVAEQVY